MRKLVSGLFISMDGVVEAPDQWQFDSFDDDMGEEMGKVFDRQDMMMMGRVTYQEWHPYWPNSTDEPIATIINNMPKVVVSKTLDNATWGKYDAPKVIGHNLAEEIAALKAQPGKHIGVGGSPMLVNSLLYAGLLDELTLMVHPVVVGKGKHLFNNGDALKQMKVTSSRVTGSGVAILIYEPR